MGGPSTSKMRRRGDVTCQALTEKIGEGPGEEEHYHLFSVDIESTAFGIIEDGERWFAGFEGARPAERPPGTMIPGTG